jgi:hypothetical protein
VSVGFLRPGRLAAALQGLAGAGVRFIPDERGCAATRLSDGRAYLPDSCDCARWFVDREGQGFEMRG